MTNFIFFKNISFSLFATLAFLFLIPVAVSAEEINLFESQIEINDDSSLTVKETIVYNFGALQQHGIFRYIEHRHPQEASAWYKKRYIDIEVSEVSRNGEAERFVVDEELNKTSLKIGKAEEYVTGEQVYEITYKVFGALSYLPNGQVEIYWNTTGNGWQVPINQAVGIIGPPSRILSEYDCYKGEVYSAIKCDEKTFFPGGVAFMANSLGRNEGLTIAAALEPTGLPVVVNESIKLIFVILPLVLVSVGVLVRFIYKTITFHKPKNSTVIAQYEPYQDIKPMFTGVLLDNRLDPKDITAGLLYLAQQGFIKVKKGQKKVLFFIDLDDYEVTLLKSIEDSPTQFHKELLDLLFPAQEVGEMVKLSDLKKDQRQLKKNYKKIQKLKKAIKNDLLSDGFYEKKYGLLRRTRKGYEALFHLKGFKDFLSVTDKERFKFHNAPGKSPEQFMLFLPFAVAFGVEEEWAEVFNDVAIEMPEWYEGSQGSFNAVSFGKELSVLNTALVSASGSGYSSGSGASGGGFSGGGGGGGGGGSW